jgi:hypothetical protein
MHETVVAGAMAEGSQPCRSWLRHFGARSRGTKGLPPSVGIGVWGWEDERKWVSQAKNFTGRAECAGLPGRTVLLGLFV